MKTKLQEEEAQAAEQSKKEMSRKSLLQKEEFEAYRSRVKGEMDEKS